MLVFKLRNSIRWPVEVFDTSPDALIALSLEKVQQQKVYAGNRAVTLESLFEISGDASDGLQHWQGNLQNVSGIGYRMKSGWIRITGNAGNCVGARMSDGAIHVDGDVGAWAGCEMSGGLVHVRGHAGNGVGAAWPGSATGQNGGAILIEGSAGNCLGQSMRRGVIAVTGDVGNCCGWLMRAGTILVGGEIGKNLGAEMRRGTIVLLRGQPKRPQGFDAAGTHPMPVTNLLDRYLCNLGLAFPLDNPRYEVWHGDRLWGGRGELLIARNATATATNQQGIVLH